MFDAARKKWTKNKIYLPKKVVVKFMVIYPFGRIDP